MALIKNVNRAKEADDDDDDDGTEEISVSQYPRIDFYFNLFVYA